MTPGKGATYQAIQSERLGLLSSTPVTGTDLPSRNSARRCHHLPGGALLSCLLFFQLLSCCLSHLPISNCLSFFLPFFLSLLGRAVIHSFPLSVSPLLRSPCHEAPCQCSVGERGVSTPGQAIRSARTLRERQ